MTSIHTALPTPTGNASQHPRVQVRAVCGCSELSMPSPRLSPTLVTWQDGHRPLSHQENLPWLPTPAPLFRPPRASALQALPP